MIVRRTPEVVVCDRLGEWSTPWNELVDALPIPSPFLRSWWLESTAGADPSFVLVLEHGQLLGGLAVDVDRRLGIGRLRHMGHGTLKPDHLDLVTTSKDRSVVVQGVREWLAQGRWLVELSGLVAESQVRDALPERRRTRVIGAAPYADLPSTFAEYRAALPSQLRNTIGRAGKRLDKLGAEYRRVPCDAVGPALVELRRLHTLRFGETSGVLPAWEQFAAAVAAGAGVGEAVIHDLAVEGRSIAMEVWFEVAGTASFYQSGRDLDPRWDGSGTVLKAAVIEGLFEREIRVIDLLREDEPYKRSWAPQARSIVSVEAAYGIQARAVALALPIVRTAQRARLSVAGVARGLRRRGSAP